MGKYKKTCNTQVNIPEVDNSSPCEDFVYSECTIVNRKSKIFKNTEDKSLNVYLDNLEDELRRTRLRLTTLEKLVKNLISIMPEAGIGIYED